MRVGVVEDGHGVEQLSVGQQCGVFGLAGVLFVCALTVQKSLPETISDEML